MANLFTPAPKAASASRSFLDSGRKDSAISTSRRFMPSSSGRMSLQLPVGHYDGRRRFRSDRPRRENLVKYVQHGGFLLASSGCSSQEWDRSFRQEMTQLFRRARCKRSKWTIQCFIRSTTSRIANDPRRQATSARRHFNRRPIGSALLADA